MVDVTLIEMLGEQDAKPLLNSAQTNNVQKSNSANQRPEFWPRLHPSENFTRLPGTRLMMIGPSRHCWLFTSRGRHSQLSLKFLRAQVFTLDVLQEATL